MAENIEKMYWSIGEVASMFDVKPSLIRYWEKEFPVIKPHKNKKGNRYFTQEDIENLKLIYHLVKERGMTLRGAKMKLKENKNDTENNYEVINSLKEIRNYLLQLKNQL
jgi:DNA-binding transcriptional MerR regulator